MSYASKDPQPLSEIAILDQESIDAIVAQLPPGGYEHPSTHPATMITEDTSHQFITTTEKNNIHALNADNQDLSGLEPKQTGKSLSTNDYTTAEQTKLSGIEAGANNYSHPANHAPSIITQDVSNRFVSDTEKGTWNGKEPGNSNIQTHVTAAHAPSNAQKNSDITKAEIEAKLTGELTSHTHAGGGSLTLGELSTNAYYGDKGKTAYDHSQVAHAPEGAEVNVNADWNASSGDAQIMNKPTISGSNTGDNSANSLYSGLAASKQDTLVSATNIKTINSASVLGSGNLVVTGADPFLSKLVLASDKPTGNNVTPVTLGLSFNYVANSQYVIDIYAIVAPTAASTGCGFMIDVSTAVTYVGTFVAHQLAITGTLSGAASAGDLAAASSGVSSGMVLAGSNFVYGGGILVTGANAGTATFFFRSETTAVTTCKTGTCIRVLKMN